MLFAVTFAVTYGFLSNATTSQSIATENYKIIKNQGSAKNVYKYISFFTTFK